MEGDAPKDSANPAKPMTRVRSSSFKYYIHDGIHEFRLQLLGELTEAEVAELSGCWRTARTTLGKRKLILDLEALKAVDEAGKEWLISMASEGASYQPDGFLRHGLVGQAAEKAVRTRSAGKLGLFGKLLSILKGATPAESTPEP